MPTGLDTLLQWPDRRIAVLAEITPSYTLRGWTSAAPTYPTSYKIAMPAFVQTDVIVAGVYRRVVGLRQNGTDLLDQMAFGATPILTALGQVESTAGSYAWDEVGGMLYVHTTSGASPDTFTLYHAFVRFFVATEGVVPNDGGVLQDFSTFHWPWMDGEAPRISQSVGDILSGIKSSEFGDLRLTNTHKFWNKLVASNSLYNWKNKKVRLFVGGRRFYPTSTEPNDGMLQRAEYEALLSMLIDDVAADETECRFTLKPPPKLLDRTLPITPFFSSDYPNLGDGVQGTKKWIGYGRAVIAPDLTDTSGLGVYTIADAAFQTLFAVSAAYSVDSVTGVRTTLTLATDYTVNLTTCTLTIVNATYGWTTGGTIEVDVTGKPDGGSSYLKTAGAILKDMLTTFLMVPTADIDTAAFAAADVENNAELSVWLKAPRSMTSIIGGSDDGLPSIEKSVMGTLIQTSAGLWTFYIWTPTYNAATALALRREDMAEFKPEPTIDLVVSTIYVNYRQNLSTDAWATEFATDLETQYKSETTDHIDVWTYLRDSSAAIVLAQRYMLIAGAISTEVAFTERAAITARSKPGDKVLVTYDPAPDASGAWSSKVFEILLIEKSFVPVLEISGRLGDLRGFGFNVGKWAGATAPNWATASAAEKIASGFWCDAASLIDPADTATRERSIWW